jgi:hypothetical protein
MGKEKTGIFEEMPDCKVINGIIEKLSGAEKKALIHIRDAFYSGKDSIFVEMDNETFKKIQNNFNENKSLKSEIEKLKNKSFFTIIKEKIWKHFTTKTEQ